MKVLVCGPRTWVEQKPILDVLTLFPMDTVIVHGGARGVDNIAGFVALQRGLPPVRAYPVDPKVDGPWPGAGHRRNRRMLMSENPHAEDGTYVTFGLAFGVSEELTPGTRNMFGQLTLAKVPTLKVLYQKRAWPNTLELLKKELGALGI